MRKKGAALRDVQRPLTAFRQAQDERALGSDGPTNPFALASRPVSAHIVNIARAHAPTLSGGDCELCVP
jgi:hypothetical protein